MRNKRGLPSNVGVSLGARSVGTEVSPSTGASDRSESIRRSDCTGAADRVIVESGTVYFLLMAYEKIIYDASAGVATITLNQPDTRNALSNEVLSDLIEAFSAARDDDDVRCVVLT